MKGKSNYRLLYRYVGKEYLLSFIVAFLFFFFIFFVNQILLVAQKILVKNVSIPQVIQLVSLAIPQFLLYTFPFSSLTASAMVLGDFSSGNEILALRSSGVSMRHVFLPICVLSLCVSALTLYTANSLLPETSRMYKDKYVQMMRDLPTLELSSYGANTIGDKVLVNARTEGATVNDLVLFSKGNSDDEQVVSSPKTSIVMTDPVNFIYRLDLSDPHILSVSRSKPDDWNLATAESATMFLDFSSLVSSVTDTVPSQLSIGDLSLKSKEKKKELDDLWRQQDVSLYTQYDKLAQMSDDPSFHSADYNSITDVISDQKKESQIVFYYQYYRAEMHKKIALSMACFLLVFLTFPLSYRRLKHGRIIGFGIAMFSAVVYWYLLFFAQLYIFRTSLNPGFLIWMPDVVLFLVGLFALWKVKS